MSLNALNDTFKQQQRKLVRSTFKKGFINAVYPNSYTVDIYYAENPQQIMRNIPVAKSVAISTVRVQQRCRIDIFDETNPNDMVVAYTY